MLTQFVILLAILISAGAPLTRADAGQEASPTELLASLERPVWSRRGDQQYMKRVLAAYDPLTGLRQELTVQEDPIPREGKNLCTAISGNSMFSLMFKPTPCVIRVRGDERTAIPFPSSPDLERAIARSHAVRVMEPSPDALGWVAYMSMSDVVMHHEQTTRVFDLKWIDWEGGTGMNDVAFSWSPDSRKVAFYYAYAEGMRASPAIRDFGVALVTFDEGLVELVKPSGRTTAWLGIEAIPPQWSSDSQYVYFVQGPVPGEKLQPKVHPAFTYRVDIRTGQEEKLAQGTATSVAPDDSYLLLSAHCVKTEKGDVEGRSAKLDLRTRKVELLPPLVGLPRISPSGRYVVAMCRDKERFVARFFDASDWSMISDPGPIQGTGTLAEWYTFCRWITLDSPPQPAVPTTQP